MELVDVLNAAGTAALAIISGGLASAIVTLLQNRWLEKRRADEAERARLRQVFAEAYEVYTDYKEFPYLIRRRRGDRPEEERARLVADLTAVQSKLSYYQAWTVFESPSVGEAYGRLVREMRRVVGGAMHAAWTDQPSQGDAGMNISRGVIDLSELDGVEAAYVQAVSARMRQLTPRKLRRK